MTDSNVRRMYLARHGVTLFNVAARRIVASGVQDNVKRLFALARKNEGKVTIQELDDLFGNSLETVLEDTGYSGDEQELYFSDLSPKGCEQAKRLGDYIVREGLDVSTIHCSSSSRARYTGYTIENKLIYSGNQPEVFEHDTFREISERQIEQDKGHYSTLALENVLHNGLLVAHKRINISILKGLGVYPGEDVKDIRFGNCGLAIFEFDSKGFLSNFRYSPNEEM